MAVIPEAPPATRVATAAATNATASVPHTTQLPYADFFRALAIFYVFLGHADGIIAGPVLVHHFALVDGVSLFDGVAMLFCLSGFLLSAPLLRAYLDTPHTLPLVRPYLYARFLRIYPLYAAAVVAISIALAVEGRTPTAGDIAMHLALLQNFSTATVQSLSGPLWTMPLDAQFYLLLPIGFALVARALGDRDLRSRIRALYAILAVIVAASIAYRFGVVWHFAPVAFERKLVIVDAFPGMAALFALGIAARFTTMLIERGLLPLRITPRSAIGLLLAALLARTVQFGAHEEWLRLAAGANHLRPAFFASFDEAAGGLGCACLLVAASEWRTGWFGRFIASPFVAFAAAISYAFYLLHLTVLNALGASLGGLRHGGFLALIAGGLLILVPVCFAAHHAIEQPFLERKARLRRERGELPA
jgi:peptidoglycan/LPS O-acetylase OafA/YrhL